MTAILFNVGNALVVPGWLLLLAAPRWKWTTRVASAAIPFLLGVTYVALIASNLRLLTTEFAQSADIGWLFAHPPVLLAGWLHYLAFDLFIGAWQVRDAARVGLPRWLVATCLLLTLLLGPTGLVAYYVVRWSRQHPGLLAPLKRIALESCRRSCTLTVAGASLLILVPFLLLLASIDPRNVLGINVWVKPIKFSVSLGIYFLTLAWLLGHLSRPRWAVRTIAWGTAGAVFFEIPFVVIQAVRGVPLHFNTSTPLDAALYLATGAAACTQVALLAGALLLFCSVQTNLPRLYLYGIRAGMVLFLAGMLPGFAMVAHGQHSVGVADGGVGLPVLNWSAMGGDLRVAHFLGLHAIQLLPLVGYMLSRPVGAASRWRSALLRLFAIAYAFAMVGAFVQALAGQPFISVHGTGKTLFHQTVDCRPTECGVSAAAPIG